MAKPVRFGHLLVAAVLGGLVASALPAAAAQVGDAFKLGETNAVSADTGLEGDTASNLVIRNTGSGTPLNLINDANGKAPMKVDSRRLVKNLNVDKLDFRHANELMRAAFDSTSDALDANGAAVTANITAPKPGILIMGGSIDASGAEEDSYACSLKVNDPVDPVSGTIRHSKVHQPGGDHASNSQENCSTDGAQVVDAGAHEVKLNVSSRDTNITFSNASVWVIWVPFDGNGNVPTP